MSLPFMQPYMGLGNSLQTAQGGAGGTVGGWVELGRTTLGATADLLTVSSLADKRYYMLLSSKLVSGDCTHQFLLNNDTGTNYARRISINGAADSTGTSASNFDMDPSNATNSFVVSHIANLAAKEKLMISNLVSQNTAGAGTAPQRLEFTGKWANTANAISRFDLNNSTTGDYAAGTELVVLGWDPADTHTSNFWEELASVEVSSGDDIASGTITAKKYLWIQIYTKNSGTAGMQVSFNGDTGSNYAQRTSHTGGADSVNASINNINLGHTKTAPHYANVFLINNSANEKIGFSQTCGVATAGAGTAPVRSEFAFKWANTSSQITSVNVNNSDTGSYATGTIMKVWGSD